MSVKYRLVKRKNLGADKASTPEKVYAQAVYGDLVTFEELLGDITESGIPTNQVKGVTDRMVHQIKKHLAAGRRVQFGELGNFRYGVGSIGVLNEEDFDSSLIRVPKVIFVPGNALREAKKDVKFEKYIPKGVTSGVKEEETDKPEEL
ncbi:MAG: DNA-binding protein [Parabacteroides sp.]|nr:DNA-binding protein [Parabacteroides sp.]